MDEDLETQIKTAIQHAGAALLLWLQSAERGYTSLSPNEPLVTQGVDLANREAMARGVPADAINVTPSHVITAAQEMGASGADPTVVAAETKAPDADATTADEDASDNADEGATGLTPDQPDQPAPPAQPAQQDGE